MKRADKSKVSPYPATEVEQAEFALMLNLRAIELSETWRVVDINWVHYLTKVVRVSPSRYRRWVETYAGDALVTGLVRSRMKYYDELRNGVAS